MLSTCNSQFFKQKDALDFCLHYCGLVTKLCPTLETHWAVARQTPLSMAFSRQDWSGLPFPSPGDLPNPGIKPRSPMLQVVSCIAGRFFFFLLTEPPGKTCLHWDPQIMRTDLLVGEGNGTHTPVFLPGESQGRGSLVGCHL